MGFLRNVRDFFIPKVPFWGFLIILKNPTDFRKTMETGVHPPLLGENPSLVILIHELSCLDGLKAQGIDY